MTQDEIIEMARQAGIYHAQDSEYHWDGLTDQKIIERTPDSAKDIAWRNRRTFEILKPFAKLVAEKALAQQEQESVAWLLTDKNINSLQVESIQRLIDRLKHAHHTDLCVRINGHDEWFEADWLKHMVRVTPPQRTEQCNYPDCKCPTENPCLKGLAQLEQEPVAFEEWLSKQHGDPEEIGFLQALRIAYISGQDSITTPPRRKPLTDEEIYKIANDLFYGNGPCDTLAMCRAIEAAHGIKENT